MLLADNLKAVQDPVLNVPGLELPDGWTLRPYQKVDATFLCMQKRAVLGELPAAGKKLIAITACLKLFELGKAQRVLIVSLGSDADQWIEEVDKVCDRHVTAELYRGSPKHREYLRNQGHAPDFHVTTYQTIRADLVYLLGVYDVIILDEVSYIRNCESAAHWALRTLCSPDPHEIIPRAQEGLPRTVPRRRQAQGTPRTTQGPPVPTPNTPRHQ